MKKRIQLMVSGCLFAAAMQSALASVYYIENLDPAFWTEAKSWHDTNGWKNGILVPSGTGQSVNLVSKPIDYKVELRKSAVSLKNLTVGCYGTPASNTATLLVENNLVVSGKVLIGSHNTIGAGRVEIGHATLSSVNNSEIGKTSNGSLIINRGGMVAVSPGRVYLYGKGSATVNEGVFSIGDVLIMTNGAALHLNGFAQLRIEGEDATGGGNRLTQYINDGWIYGDGIPGNVQAISDGTSTVVTVKNQMLGMSGSRLDGDQFIVELDGAATDREIMISTNLLVGFHGTATNVSGAADEIGMPTDHAQAFFTHATGKPAIQLTPSSAVVAAVDAARPLNGGTVPADYASRFGITHYGGRYTLTTNGTPFLQEGVEKIVELGFRSTKLWLSARSDQVERGYYFNSSWPSYNNSTRLVDVATNDYFKAAFSNDLDSFMLEVNTRRGEEWHDAPYGIGNEEYFTYLELPIFHLINKLRF